MPFETIYTEGRVEGVFRIDTPAINFGYDHVASSASARRKESSAMFEGAEEEGGGHAPGGVVARPAEEEGFWGAFMRLLECLSQTHSQLTTKHPDDSLYYSGSHLHQDTHVSIYYTSTPEHCCYCIYKYIYIYISAADVPIILIITFYTFYFNIILFPHCAIL